jgi:ferredoxin
MGSDSDRHADSLGRHWQVEVDADKCSLCEVCGARCPTGAIRSEQTGDTLSILFRYRLCDGCRDCLKICPEKAMRLAEAEAEPGAPDEIVLAANGMLRCSVCGVNFAPEAKLRSASERRGNDADMIPNQCPLCRRTQMVVRFIEEKRKTEGRMAEYKTGTKWYWKPVTPGDSNAPPCPDVQAGPSD